MKDLLQITIDLGLKVTWSKDISKYDKTAQQPIVISLVMEAL
jgi:hypothetical protein